MMDAWEVVVWIDLVIGLVVAGLCVAEAVRKDELDYELNDAAVLILMVPFWLGFLAAFGVEKAWARYQLWRYGKTVRKK